MRSGEERCAALVSVLLAALLLLLFSRCSPLYPTNNWGAANAFFTVGRGMLAGKLPYRDFALNAGPLARLAERLWSRRRAWGGVLAVCVGFNCLTNGNLPYIGYPAEELPQQKFAQIMAENGGGSMLTLEIPDSGFYLAAGALPENARFADCLAWFVSSVASEGLKSQYDVLERNGVE